MQKDQLLELRRKIVQTAQDIALHGEGTPEERLQVLLDVVRSGDASIDVLTKVYELSGEIESDDEKLTALLDLLYEVDVKISQENAPQSEVEPASTEQVHQALEHNDQPHDQY